MDTGAHLLLCLEQAARLRLSLPARFAVLCHDLGKATTPTNILPRHHGHEQRSAALAGPLCQRLRVPNDCRDLALAVARHHGNAGRAAELRTETLLALFNDVGALRSPQKLTDFLDACEADYRGRLGYADREWKMRAYLQAQFAAVQAVDAGAIAQASAPEKIAEAIRQARIAALMPLRTSWQNND